MTTSPNARRFVVAVHDVTPAHADQLRRIFAALDGIGLERAALLVVPDWHGRWPLTEHAAFAAQLRQRHERGAEIFLHGWRHDEDDSTRTLWDRVRIAGRTARSAEFFLLPPDRAGRRLDDGRALLERLQLPPVGFIPPAWLFRRGLVAQLRDHGFGLTEDFWWIRHAPSGRRRFAPALSWSSARPWRSTLTSRGAALRHPVERKRSLVRVAIHPPDIDIPVVWHSVMRTLRMLVAEREAVTYSDVF